MTERKKNDDGKMVRLMGIDEAAAYLGLGKNSTRRFAEESGAVRRYGRRWLVDRVALDKALDQIGQGA